MPRFYLTFGVNTGHASRYRIIEASEMQAARLLAFEEYGPKWAFCYDEEGFAGQADRYHLTPFHTVLGASDESTS
jgi:hypothetical protein